MGPWSPCSACTSKHLQPAKDPWPTGRSTSPIPPPPTDSRTLPSSPLPSTASLPSTGSALIMYSHLATTHGKTHSPFRALGPPQCVPLPPTTTRQLSHRSVSHYPRLPLGAGHSTPLPPVPIPASNLQR